MSKQNGKTFNYIAELEKQVLFNKNKLQYLIYLLNQQPPEDVEIYLINKYYETYYKLEEIETYLTYKGVLENEKRNYM